MIALALLLAAPAVETRCGWLENPTPANLTLVDRDGEWTISQQGSYEAPGIDELPPRNDRQWVFQNVGSYGYGCACLRVTTDRKSQQVTRVIGGTTEPLGRCRADRRLPRP